MFFLPENDIWQFCPLFPSYLWNYREKKNLQKGKMIKKLKWNLKGECNDVKNKK